MTVTVKVLVYLYCAMSEQDDIQNLSFGLIKWAWYDRECVCVRLCARVQ